MTEDSSTGAPQTFDRGCLVNAFLARLAVYQRKVEERMLEPDISISPGEVSLECQKAIEWLAGELGLFDDLLAAGYEEAQ